MPLACRLAIDGGRRELQPDTGTGYSPRPVGALPMRAEGARFKPDTETWHMSCRDAGTALLKFVGQIGPGLAS